MVLPGTCWGKQPASWLNRGITSCATAPSGGARAPSHRQGLRKLSVEEGSRVCGVLTETSWGAGDVRLLSVGRDGRIVRVLHGAQFGGFEGAPVKAFQQTAAKAADRLR
ncbi:hypothetical protein [Streptomyces sp. 6-11-2]|uniref:hypothetical protein n=1 Tax=Streptomyces sp. 6-11-2 TaxID=2585753 RepID=UPI0011707506|nr:hypothetical protein [Streptomyces sp. 6-11-2]GED90080.1 hypothetical protein TNCT6_71650 [Streptomyces sp. 6-11-2]